MDDDTAIEALKLALESALREVSLATEEQEKSYWQVSAWRIESMIENLLDALARRKANG